MSISRPLIRRIQEDAKAPDHWYVPKGKAAKPENWPLIAKQLRVLQKFESLPWDEAQPRLEKELRRAGLIEPYKKGFSAVARMQFPVWRLFGFAWVNTRGEPEITDVGRKFASAGTEDARRKLLTLQLHRYQFYNPSLPPHFSRFRTFPILALYRLLSQTEWRISWREFLLFGTRSRGFSDADELATLVEEFRQLTNSERDRVVDIAKTLPAESHTKSAEGTTWGKVFRELNYVRSVLRILPALEVRKDTLAVPRAMQRHVQSLVVGRLGTVEFIEYESEQDWLATYGQLPPKDRWSTPWTVADDARLYYERVGRIDAATDAFSKEKARPARAVAEYKSIQILERVLEDLLEHNLGRAGIRLKANRAPVPHLGGPNRSSCTRWQRSLCRY